jgi:hypothetical protein
VIGAGEVAETAVDGLTDAELRAVALEPPLAAC